MRFRTHIAWALSIVALSNIFIVSLWSDVWEAYLAVLVLAVAGYGVALWRAYAPRSIRR